jgi:myo-inositol catabolism protein IolC
MTLRDVAHSRTGDKGIMLNFSVIARDERDYPWLVEVVTPERVSGHLGVLIDRQVRRYLLPEICAMNFVASRPPGQSVTRSLAIDPHGKSLSSALLEMPIPER